MRLENKVALVTGASRGIGRAVAIRFAQEGAHVALGVEKSVQAAQEVADVIRALGREELIAVADVSKRGEVDHMVQEILERMGKIDILVNNAGIIHLANLWEISEAQWDRVINVHLKGTFNCTQAVVKQMMERGRGKIVNVTAPSALRGSGVGVADYASAKGGIIAFTKTAARELAPFRINVNCICPVAHTRMTDRLIEFHRSTLQQYAAHYPMGWLAEPEEVAPRLRFFCIQRFRLHYWPDLGSRWRTYDVEDPEYLSCRRHQG